MSNDKCPVDHKSKPTDECPVDQTHSTWGEFLPKHNSISHGPNGPLSTDRETSSIPKTNEDNWVYPSEAQFFAAMARKNHNPHTSDMKVIVPIHNAVNERAWGEVMKWEVGRGGESCGGVRLVNFKGKPGQMSPKARWKSLLGYSPPFDRHDWVIDRCGLKMRYVIDFYTGKSDGPSSNSLSFFLDVRPALDNWEGIKMRAERLWDRWFGKLGRPTPSNSKTAGS